MKSEVVGGEFLTSDVHELVDGKGVGLIGELVVGLNELIVFVEDSKSVPVLIGLSLLSAIDLLPGSIKSIDFRRNRFVRLDSVLTKKVSGSTEEDGKAKGEDYLFHLYKYLKCQDYTPLFKP